MLQIVIIVSDLILDAAARKGDGQHGRIIMKTRKQTVRQCVSFAATLLMAFSACGGALPQITGTGISVAVSAEAAKGSYTFENGSGILTFQGGTFSDYESLTHDTANPRTYENYMYDVDRFLVQEIHNNGGSSTKFSGDMSRLFKGMKNAYTIDLSGLDSTDVTCYNEMFKGCNNLQTLNIGSFNVTRSLMYNGNNAEMFDFAYGGKSKIKSLTLPAWFKVTTDLKLPNIDENYLGWAKAGTTKIISGRGQYADFVADTAGEYVRISKEQFREDAGTYSFNENTGELVITGGSFSNYGLRHVEGHTYEEWFYDIYKPLIKSVRVNASAGAELSGNCTGMFSNMENCTSIDLTGLATGKVYNFNEMFANNPALTNLKVPIVTSNATSMASMFYNCPKVSTLDISSFYMDKVTSKSEMLALAPMNGYSSITTLKLPRNFKVTKNEYLPNKDTNYVGWAKSGSKSVVSGSKDYAVFTSDNANIETYTRVKTDEPDSNNKSIQLYYFANGSYYPVPDGMNTTGVTLYKLVNGEYVRYQNTDQLYYYSNGSYYPVPSGMDTNGMTLYKLVNGVYQVYSQASSTQLYYYSNGSYYPVYTGMNTNGITLYKLVNGVYTIYSQPNTNQLYYYLNGSYFPVYTGMNTNGMTLYRLVNGVYQVYNQGNTNQLYYYSNGRYYPVYTGMNTNGLTLYRYVNGQYQVYSQANSNQLYYYSNGSYYPVYSGMNTNGLTLYRYVNGQYQVYSQANSNQLYYYSNGSYYPVYSGMNTSGMTLYRYVNGQYQVYNGTNEQLYYLNNGVYYPVTTGMNTNGMTLYRFVNGQYQIYQNGSTNEQLYYLNNGIYYPVTTGMNTNGMTLYRFANGQYQVYRNAVSNEQLYYLNNGVYYPVTAGMNTNGMTLYRYANGQYSIYNNSNNGTLNLTGKNYVLVNGQYYEITSSTTASDGTQYVFANNRYYNTNQVQIVSADKLPKSASATGNATGITYYASNGKLHITWDNEPAATSYILYQVKSDGYKKIKETTSSTATLGNAKGGKTYEVVVCPVINGNISSPDNAQRVTVKVPVTKPVVTAKVSGSSVMLSWETVPNAEKYRVYKYVDGSLKKMGETKKLNVKITSLAKGKYTFAVKAYVNGKWTTVTKSDLAAATVK